MANSGTAFRDSRHLLQGYIFDKILLVDLFQTSHALSNPIYLASCKVSMLLCEAYRV